jgi:hypothetical protein
MENRSTYDRRIEQLEAAVIAFGHGVAHRRRAELAPHHRAIEVAVDALVASPLAAGDDVRRIRTLQDVDFHVRHVDRLVETLAPCDRSRPELLATLAALESALIALETRDFGRLERLDRAIEHILDGAERPLLVREGIASTPDARVRRAALHVLAIAEAARSLVPAHRTRPAAPVG